MATIKSAPNERPKALLFDIGGVCVISPMSAILAYEQSKGIPPGWVNFAISHSKPDGAWHKLERGDIVLDETFFKLFQQDLRSAKNWRTFLLMLARRQAQKTSQQTHQIREADLPPVPDVEAEPMFWEMMRVSREPDPYMAPALRRLRQSGQFVIGALSNTVVFPPGHPYSMPPDDPDQDVRAQFDVFVSSAHVGLRKPERPIYELAVRWLRDAYRDGTWGKGESEQRGELKPEDIIFLDDIGENLKAAKALGMRTIKVPLGGTKEVVQQLEKLTGLKLLDADDKSRL